MQIDTLINLCGRFASITDNERLEELLRQGEDSSGSVRAVYLDDERLEESIRQREGIFGCSPGAYSLYQRLRLTCSNWADLEWIRSKLNAQRRHVFDNYPIPEGLISELSAIFSNIESDPERPLHNRVLDAIRNKGLFAETLSAEHDKLVAEVSKS